MAILDSCPKHNMVAYLEKTEGNAEFHEIIDFLKRSSIHHALIDEGRAREMVDEVQGDLKKINFSTEDVLSTEEHIEGTEEQVESTDGQRKGTEDHTEERSATQATQTPTSTMFGDDETIAKVLLNMSQAKAVSREKEKGVELKDIEEIDRPRPTSTRSLLTLKPLPKIDPKDKGKKKIEEEDESESESDGIPQAEKKFKQLESDEEMARKIQEEWEEEEERNRIAEEKATNEALIRNFDDIKARIEADRLLAEKLQEQEREQFTIEERAKFLHDTIAAQRKFLAQQRSEAIRNRPPTKNQLRNQMMTYLKHVENFKHAELKNQEFVQNHTTNGHQFTMLNRHKNWLVHKQTACGKDFSNPFMVDNLPKIVGFSTHLASLVKSWLVQDQTVLALASPKANELTIPEQTATGKGTSNPFMAGSLPKTTKPT
ncbi:hypothetical protein Tco_1032824 [Tanacetum coccineum]|uniref:Uncharacterized protein n=1 Tax=Tanacetum coccineum TaxID=301880 RepID=A0ABQ5GFD7_9ASTR